jgi:hypothetical protein
MPKIDFTLEDLKSVIDLRLENFKPVIKSIVDTSIDARFKVFEEKYDNDMTAIQQDFLQIYDRFAQIDRRFEQVDLRFEQMDRHFEQVDHHFDKLEGELKTTNRLVRKHSADIIELQARPI